MEIEGAVEELCKLGYFSDQKLSGRDLMVTCPFHKNGRERKPSFGINLDNGKCNCLTCGWKGNINKLAEKLTGKRGWVEQHTKYKPKLKRRQPIKLGKHQNKTIPVKQVESLVGDNRKALTYLENRGIISTKGFNIGYNKQFDSLVLWVRNLNGEFVYSKARSLSGKQFYNTEDSDRGNYLFGLYEATLKNVSEVWLCESEIDALTLWQYDIPAVAIGSATLSEKQVEQLHLAGIRSVIDGLDRDVAGRQGWNNVCKLFKGLTRATDWGNINKKDINELNKEELKQILDKLNN